MAEEYKEYDLLPCPWCHEPVHVESLGVNIVGQNETYSVGYYITCGNYKCNCPETVIYDTEEEARGNWNSGRTFDRIKWRY